MSNLQSTSIKISLKNSFGAVVVSRSLPITQHNFRRFIMSFINENPNKAKNGVEIVYIEGNRPLFNEIKKDFELKKIEKLVTVIK